MLLSPSPVGYAVCDLASIAGVDVDDHDPAPMAMRGVTPAIEGDLRPIGGPRRGVVAPAFGGMGDLADMASVRVHREDSALGLILIGIATKGDLTGVGGTTLPTISRIAARVLYPQ
jgi:hypothetical protein